MKRIAAIAALVLGLASCTQHGKDYEFKPDVINGRESNCGTVEHYRWISGWTYRKTGTIYRHYVCPKERKP